jgi:hypothetical protein
MGDRRKIEIIDTKIKMEDRVNRLKTDIIRWKIAINTWKTLEIQMEEGRCKIGNSQNIEIKDTKIKMEERLLDGRW